MSVSYHCVRKINRYPITGPTKTFDKAVHAVESWFESYPEFKGDYAVLRTTIEEVES